MSGARALLKHLRCVQIDPLFPTGATNHELVFQSRLNLTREEIYEALQGYCFEHWAKQRCFISRDAFAHYYHESKNAGKSPKISWWRQEERQKLVGQEKIDSVLEAVRASGAQPVTYLDLPQFGTAVKDWVDDAAPSNLTNMALEVLWSQMDIVITGREIAPALRTKKKIYTAAEHVFADEIEQTPPKVDFLEFLLLERVRAAGLLPLSSAPAMWSLIEETRGDVVNRLVESGLIQKVKIGDKNRQYLALSGLAAKLQEVSSKQFDDRVRILGPLDPLIWDRDLVKQLWDFEYKWEVYTPKAKRVWGYYVCPLLYKGNFIGRIEMKSDSNTFLNLIGLWLHDDATTLKPAVFAAVERHARLNRLTLAATLTPELIVSVNSDSNASETPKKPARKSSTWSKKRKRDSDSDEEDANLTSEEDDVVKEVSGANSDDEFVPSKSAPRKRTKLAVVAAEDDDAENTKPKRKSTPGRTTWKSV